MSGRSTPRRRSNVPVDNAHVLHDRLLYPVMMDPVSTGRVEPKYNEMVPPYFQNRDFLGTDLPPWMCQKPYLTKYRQMKTECEINTATADMLDPFLVNSANHFVGDYHSPYPDMIYLIDDSTRGLNENSKPNDKYGIFNVN